ncbi:hypothetical protein LAZ67_7000962 [Cordylochernes scorpioides]|uniref:Uncharacterized protein n=1 Tax=Cordylochernes scorpioides TaxID=51811 RepID=A0ABY6KLV5_9ARAC|nr:hypothetical protein LAZ67_7000962 [Cordylochernes scorpioides]
METKHWIEALYRDGFSASRKAILIFMTKRGQVNLQLSQQTKIWLLLRKFVHKLLSVVGYRKLCSKWVSKLLTREMMQTRKDICLDLIESYPAPASKAFKGVIIEKSSRLRFAGPSVAIGIPYHTNPLPYVQLHGERQSIKQLSELEKKGDNNVTYKVEQSLTALLLISTDIYKRMFEPRAYSTSSERCMDVYLTSRSGAVAGPCPGTSAGGPRTSGDSPKRLYMYINEEEKQFRGEGEQSAVVCGVEHFFPHNEDNFKTKIIKIHAMYNDSVHMPPQLPLQSLVENRQRVSRDTTYFAIYKEYPGDHLTFHTLNMVRVDPEPADLTFLVQQSI